MADRMRVTSLMRPSITAAEVPGQHGGGSTREGAGCPARSIQRVAGCPYRFWVLKLPGSTTRFSPALRCRAERAGACPVADHFFCHMPPFFGGSLLGPLGSKRLRRGAEPAGPASYFLPGHLGEAGLGHFPFVIIGTGI